MPNRFFQPPTTINPLHVAQALCDWISHRSAEWEAPDVLTDAGWKSKAESENEFLADDSRNRGPVGRAALDAIESTRRAVPQQAVVYGVTASRPPVDVLTDERHSSGLPKSFSPLPTLLQETCDVRVL